MNKDDHISEEQLNALVDGELDSEEKGNVYDQAEQSAELDQRLCQQRKLKELVKHAYSEVPEPKRHSVRGRSPVGMLGFALAASLFLAVGAAASFFIQGYLGTDSSRGGYVAATNAGAVVAPQNYILHVASGDTKQMKHALQQARELLEAAEPGKPRQVEVVANERGLNLLRSDVTPFADEISALADKSVIFYACSKAIQRLEEKGVEVQLVPEAIPGYTALDRVVIRMKDGWQYIKI